MAGSAGEIRVVAICAAGVLVACAEEPRTPTIHEDDVDAWRGAPLIDLETHSVFASQPREIRQLSDGRQMWLLRSCNSLQHDVTCRSGPGGFGTVATRCAGGHSETTCCTKQFLVRASQVERLQMNGNCMTSCASRPASNPCRG